ncbi:MAG: hypothetical protein K0R12_890 [Gammaproteobacteria bacterium]|nr:hypothetical protein [Gammaproteobacteria bacterium]
MGTTQSKEKGRRKSSTGAEGETGSFDIKNDEEVSSPATSSEKSLMVPAPESNGSKKEKEKEKEKEETKIAGAIQQRSTPERFSGCPHTDESGSEWEDSGNLSTQTIHFSLADLFDPKQTAIHYIIQAYEAPSSSNFSLGISSSLLNSVMSSQEPITETPAARNDATNSSGGYALNENRLDAAAVYHSQLAIWQQASKTMQGPSGSKEVSSSVVQLNWQDTETVLTDKQKAAQYALIEAIKSQALDNAQEGSSASGSSSSLRGDINASILPLESSISGSSSESEQNIEVTIPSGDYNLSFIFAFAPGIIAQRLARENRHFKLNAEMFINKYVNGLISLIFSGLSSGIIFLDKGITIAEISVTGASLHKETVEEKISSYFKLANIKYTAVFAENTAIYSQARWIWQETVYQGLAIDMSDSTFASLSAYWEFLPLVNESKNARAHFVEALYSWVGEHHADLVDHFVTPGKNKKIHSLDLIMDNISLAIQGDDFFITDNTQKQMGLRIIFLTLLFINPEWLFKTGKEVILNKFYSFASQAIIAIVANAMVAIPPLQTKQKGTLEQVNHRLNSWHNNLYSPLLAETVGRSFFTSRALSSPSSTDLQWLYSLIVKHHLEVLFKFIMQKPLEAPENEMVQACDYGVKHLVKVMNQVELQDSLNYLLEMWISIYFKKNLDILVKCNLPASLASMNDLTLFNKWFIQLVRSCDAKMIKEMTDKDNWLFRLIEAGHFEYLVPRDELPLEWNNNAFSVGIKAVYEAARLSRKIVETHETAGVGDHLLRVIVQAIAEHVNENNQEDLVEKFIQQVHAVTSYYLFEASIADGLNIPALLVVKVLKSEAKSPAAFSNAAQRILLWIIQHYPEQFLFSMQAEYVETYGSPFPMAPTKKRVTPLIPFLERYCLRKLSPEQENFLAFLIEQVAIACINLEKDEYLLKEGVNLNAFLMQTSLPKFGRALSNVSLGNGKFYFKEGHEMLPQLIFQHADRMKMLSRTQKANIDCLIKFSEENSSLSLYKSLLRVVKDQSEKLTNLFWDIRTTESGEFVIDNETLQRQNKLLNAGHFPLLIIMAQQKEDFCDDRVKSYIRSCLARRLLIEIEKNVDNLTHLKNDLESVESDETYLTTFPDNFSSPLPVIVYLLSYCDFNRDLNKVFPFLEAITPNKEKNWLDYLTDSLMKMLEGVQSDRYTRSEKRIIDSCIYNIIVVLKEHLNGQIQNEKWFNACSLYAKKHPSNTLYRLLVADFDKKIKEADVAILAFVRQAKQKEASKENIESASLEAVVEGLKTLNELGFISEHFPAFDSANDRILVDVIGTPGGNFEKLIQALILSSREDLLSQLNELYTNINIFYYNGVFEEYILGPRECYKEGKLRLTQDALYETVLRFLRGAPSSEIRTRFLDKLAALKFSPDFDLDKQLALFEAAAKDDVNLLAKYFYKMNDDLFQKVILSKYKKEVARYRADLVREGNFSEYQVLIRKIENPALKAEEAPEAEKEKEKEKEEEKESRQSINSSDIETLMCRMIREMFALEPPMTTEDYAKVLTPLRENGPARSNGERIVTTALVRLTRELLAGEDEQRFDESAAQATFLGYLVTRMIELDNLSRDALALKIYIWEIDNQIPSGVDKAQYYQGMIERHINPRVKEDSDQEKKAAAELYLDIIKHLLNRDSVACDLTGALIKSIQLENEEVFKVLVKTLWERKKTESGKPLSHFCDPQKLLYFIENEIVKAPAASQGCSDIQISLIMEMLSQIYVRQLLSPPDEHSPLSIQDYLEQIQRLNFGNGHINLSTLLCISIAYVDNELFTCLMNRLVPDNKDCFDISVLNRLLRNYLPAPTNMLPERIKDQTVLLVKLFSSKYFCHRLEEGKAVAEVVKKFLIYLCQLADKNGFSLDPAEMVYYIANEAILWEESPQATSIEEKQAELLGFIVDHFPGKINLDIPIPTPAPQQEPMSATTIKKYVKLFDDDSLFCPLIKRLERERKSKERAVYRSGVTSSADLSTSLPLPKLSIFSEPAPAKLDLSPSSTSESSSSLSTKEWDLSTLSVDNRSFRRSIAGKAPDSRRTLPVSKSEYTCLFSSSSAMWGIAEQPREDKKPGLPASHSAHSVVSKSPDDLGEIETVVQANFSQ